MDQVSTGDETRSSVGSRRSRMRDVARSRRAAAPTVPDHFRTPAWLERSFVLPLTKPESSDVPKPRPHHEPVPQQSQPPRAESQPKQPQPPSGPTQPEAEGSTPEVEPDDAESPAMNAPHETPADVAGSAPAFVRPPSDDIDFGTVIRRADQSRSALRVAWVSTAVAGLVLIVFLLTGVLAIAVLAALVAVVAVSATVVRMRLTRAPVPRVNKP